MEWCGGIRECDISSELDRATMIKDVNSNFFFFVCSGLVSLLLRDIV